MTTAQLSRAQLVGAVEAGIHNSPSLPEPVKASLRQVATTIDQVGVGVFCSIEGCVGCPMTVAGITGKDGEFTPIAKALGMNEDNMSSFTSRFDNTVDEFLGGATVGYGVEVVQVV